ncbi:MAG TPA: hypothetical protein VMU24_03985, partial [Candidatus Acidoferrales bacterium]|nr:hypothetical protein [Candidatus Acidoferrales bacterium]
MKLAVDPLTIHLHRVPPGRRRAALVTAPRRPFAGSLFALLVLSLFSVGQIAAAQTVSVSPGTAQVNAGASTQFAATVTGASNPIVIWSLSGAGCVGITCGTINGSGLYTAPKTAPNPAVVTVTATSLANSNATGSATVQVAAATPVTVTVNPSVETVSPGSQQVFTATVSGTSNKAVYWYTSGPGCFGDNCGSVDSNGVYTAPASIPAPPTVNVIAALQSDFSKSGAAQVTIAPSVGVTVVPANVQLLIGNQQQFTAQVTGTSNSIVQWSVSGPGCSGAACGTITSGGLYTAPATAPTPATVTISATSAADSSKTGGAAVQLVSSVAVTVAPPSVHVNPNAQQQFTASIAGSSNQAVTWSLSGAGCSGTACGTITGGGVYTAPASIPAPNAVTVKATAVVDTTKY